MKTTTYQPKMFSVNGGDEMTINNFIDDYDIRDRYDLRAVYSLEVGQVTHIYMDDIHDSIEITRTR